MDFLDPRKKKAHKIKLYLGYFLVGIAILLTGVVLLYAAYGYGIDRQGDIVQNGLVFVDSTPTAAEVRYTNVAGGETKKAITDERLTLPAGEYAFEFLKEGYRPWQHTVDVHGGDVDRINYPFLFPENLAVADVSLYSKAPAFASSSPDRNTVVVAKPDNLASWDIYNASDLEQAARNLQIPGSVFTPGAKSKLTTVEWSTNNRHVLIKHEQPAGTEYVIVDTAEPTQSVNVNDTFNLKPKMVTLFDKSPTQLYILRGNNRLVRANVDNGQTGQELNNVLAYKSHGDNRLLYVSTNNAEANQVSLFIRGDGDSYKIRGLPKSPQYHLDLAQHQDHWFIVAAANQADTTFIYRDPFEVLRENDELRVLLTRTLNIDNPQKISFSDNTQYIAVQHGKNFAVYDVYEDQKHYYSFDTPFTKNSGPANWMDGHRLTAIANKKVVVFDFDGSNYQVLSGITPGTVPMFDRDYTRMLTIAPAVDVRGRAALTDTALRVGEN